MWPADATSIGAAQGNPHPSAVFWLRPHWSGDTMIHCGCNLCGAVWQHRCVDPAGRLDEWIGRFGMVHGRGSCRC